MLLKTIKNSYEYKIVKMLLSSNNFDFSGIGSRKLKRLKIKSESFILVSEKLYFIEAHEEPKEVIHDEDEERMFEVITEMHNDNHFGVNKTEEFLNSIFHRVKRSIIRDVIAKCPNCFQSQPLKTKIPMIHVRARASRERYQVDCIDLSQWSKYNRDYKYILNIIDIHTKFCMARPIKDKSALTIKNELTSVFYSYGFPQILQSDNGLEFKNQVIDKFCEDNKIIRKFSRPRHPQSNGQVERANQTLTRWLQKELYENKEKVWIDLLEKIIYNYNKTIHTATKTSPFKLFLKTTGYNINYFSENINEIPNIQENHENEKYLLRMDKNAPNSKIKKNFQVGDKVLVKKDFDKNVKSKKLKLESFYENSYGIITIIINEGCSMVKKDGKEVKYFNSQLKKIE